ncbi:unnamed protein product [Vicia faba]|uniref:Threonyl-tRNA synthetase n=1 Tax=Vicia faba TaxID=3906 RepID=A0AAV0ZPG1_VICFA|nr:unnamed protein product [Vicia faba]
MMIFFIYLKDDAHIFCRESQVKDEVRKALDFIDYVYQIFGFTYELKLSTDKSRRWTDQLHKLYLSSLEASFVNELHRSIHLRGWSFHTNADETYKCRTLQNTPTTPRQSLDLQDGCQKKINLEKISPVLESTADSHVLTGSEPGHAMLDKACSLIYFGFFVLLDMIMELAFYMIMEHTFFWIL